MHWLTNESRFCVAPSEARVHAHLAAAAARRARCAWGLPSISADDPAFRAHRGAYWRGLVWGPMTLLTYWGLRRYDHLPEVRAARLALVAQHRALFLSVWRRHAHICENYSPARATARDGDDCTGMNFYHWGALTGFVSLLEAEGGGS